MKTSVPGRDTVTRLSPGLKNSKGTNELVNNKIYNQTGTACRKRVQNLSFCKIYCRLDDVILNDGISTTFRNGSIT